jgi:hypothetical protein
MVSALCLIGAAGSTSDDSVARNVETISQLSVPGSANKNWVYWRFNFENAAGYGNMAQDWSEAIAKHNEAKRSSSRS